MLLGTILTVLTYAVWTIFGAWVFMTLWRTWRLRGFNAAIRQLFTRVPLALVLVAIGLSLLYLSILFIEPQEVGVVVSLVSPEGYRDRPLRSGLRFIVPLVEQVARYPIYWQTYTMASKPTEGQKAGDDSILARTSDGQEVSIDSSVIFQIDPEEVIRIHIEWQGRYMEDFVRPVVRGLVRTLVSQYTVDEVNSSKRLDLERDLDIQVRATFKEKGLILDRFVLRNVAFSPEYAAAVEQKQIALQNKVAADYKAEETRKLAQGEADATRTKAQAQSDALNLIAQVLAKNKDLLTYQYIDKLAPSIRSMLVPSTGQYILPLPTFEAQEAAPLPVPTVRATTPVTPTLVAPIAPVNNRPTPTPTRRP
jgi:regulator of protease activity HflC (stomatin/prohibitin superfamily)